MIPPLVPPSAPPPASPRPPAVAGTFYPNDPQQLQTDLQHYLQTPPPLSSTSSSPASSRKPPKAIIAPHAGYIYSGPIAGIAFSQLLPLKNHIHRAILIGPSHRVAFQNLAIPSASAFLTPLGSVPLHAPTISQLQSLSFISTNDQAHAPEHGLEVLLPFLIQTLGPTPIVPILFSHSHPHQITFLLDLFSSDPHTLFIISSDLSHYLTYPQARQIDSFTAHAIQNLQPHLLTPQHACGWIAIQALLQHALAHALQPTTLALANSGDTAGPKNQVVGYGAFSFA